MRIRQSQYRTLTQASALQFQQGLGLIKHRNAYTLSIKKSANSPTDTRVFSCRRLGHKPTMSAYTQAQSPIHAKLMSPIFIFQTPIVPLLLLPLHLQFIDHPSNNQITMSHYRSVPNHLRICISPSPLHSSCHSVHILSLPHFPSLTLQWNQC